MDRMDAQLAAEAPPIICHCLHAVITVLMFLLPLRHDVDEQGWLVNGYKHTKLMI
jgi:hypothetical protein